MLLLLLPVVLLPLLPVVLLLLYHLCCCCCWPTAAATATATATATACPLLLLLLAHYCYWPTAATGPPLLLAHCCYWPTAAAATAAAPAAVLQLAAQGDGDGGWLPVPSGLVHVLPHHVCGASLCACVCVCVCGGGGEGGEDWGSLRGYLRPLVCWYMCWGSSASLIIIIIIEGLSLLQSIPRRSS